MRDADAIKASWLAALEQRHLANLTKQEFTRAVRALSARYVERRNQLTDRSPLDSAGKRAAFALFYAPIHFLTAEFALEHIGARTDLTSVVDLGCGTGACGAAWAFTQESAPSLTGVDANAWAVDECRWNWKTMGLRGQVVRGDLIATTRGLLRQSNHTLATTGIVAGWSVNELAGADRDELLEVIVELVKRGSSLVVLEPLARGVSPWWDEWAGRFAGHDVRAQDVKTEVDLPEPLAAFSDAAGFRKKELGARVMGVR